MEIVWLVLVINALMLIFISRITEHPFMLRSVVAESSANVYTEEDLSLPVAILGTNRVQGIEMIQIYDYLQPPDAETDQGNATRGQWVKNSQTGMLNVDNSDSLHRAVYESEDALTTSGARVMTVEQPKVTPYFDGNGNGIAILERTIHIGTQSIGNANVKTYQTLMMAHLVRLDVDDIIVALFADEEPSS